METTNTVDAVQVEQEAMAVVSRAQAISIHDQDSYNDAAGFLSRVVKPTLAKINEFFDPNIKKANDLHKALCQQKKMIAAPVESAEREIKQNIRDFDVRQETLRREAEELARQEHERKYQETLLGHAIRAEGHGASEEEKQAILEIPDFSPAPIVAPLYQKSQGVTMRDNWKAEVTSVSELCKAIAEGKASENLVLPNQPALNSLARAMRAAMNVPGVRAVNDRGVAVRT